MKVVLIKYKTKISKNYFTEKKLDKKGNTLALLINVGTSIDCFVFTD